MPYFGNYGSRNQFAYARLAYSVAQTPHFISLNFRAVNPFLHFVAS